MLTYLVLIADDDPVGGTDPMNGGFLSRAETTLGRSWSRAPILTKFGDEAAVFFEADESDSAASILGPLGPTATMLLAVKTPIASAWLGDDRRIRGVLEELQDDAGQGSTNRWL